MMTLNMSKFVPNLQLDKDFETMSSDDVCMLWCLNFHDNSLSIVSTWSVMRLYFMIIKSNSAPPKCSFHGEFLTILVMLLHVCHVPP